MLKELINTILNRPVIGPSIRWLDLRHFDWNDLCFIPPWKTTSLDLYKKAVSVQNNLVSWGIPTWTRGSWIDISCWALITVLLCLVPELKVLGLPALECDDQGYDSSGDHYEVSTFSDFIAQLTEDQHTESSDSAPLRVLTKLESITIGLDFYEKRSKLHFIMPLMVLKSVKRFKVVSMWHRSWMKQCRVKSLTPIPNIEVLKFVACIFKDDIVTLLGRFTGIQRFCLSASPNLMFNNKPLFVENVMEGLKSSKDSLEYVDVRLVSRIKNDQPLSLSEFKRLQVAKLCPSPSIWTSGSLPKNEHRLINSLPPGLRILVCKPFHGTHDVVNLKQLYELAAEKEKHTPELRHIELVWCDISLKHMCKDCKNHCELNEKVPFYTEFIAECKAKNISWKASGTTEPEDSENNQGLLRQL
ncbi:hypothetical protein BOTCAL_0312g00140 [Botryotinia calthae]|uniref:Uncharacterized protein n=1 Tax=Botryotinia calthae TaxID=38488 RepID=A0A4Y8CTZ3_9HELO|nr:hypothetical protein BOTCAL_0312g00140 [Botryotinia calthae]